MVYRICSISGGGVRGIIPATIIERMLNYSKSKGGKGNIADLCDHVVGTSIGGLIGAGLVVSKDGEPIYAPSEIREMFLEKASVIFSKPYCKESYILDFLDYFFNTVGYIYDVNLRKFHIPLPFLAVPAVLFFWGAPALAAIYAPKAALSLIAFVTVSTFFASYKLQDLMENPTQYCLTRKFYEPAYESNGLNEVLEEKFAETTLNDTLLPFTTFSFSLKNNSLVSYSTFKAQSDKSKNFYLKDALRATSAAPTYFPRTSEHEVDAGICLNSPISAAVTVVKKYGSEEVKQKIASEGISVLSIGTGIFSHRDLHKNFTHGEGLLSWVKHFSKVTMSGTEQQSIMDGIYLHNTSRVDIDLHIDLPMDTADLRQITALQNSVVQADFDSIFAYEDCIASLGKAEACFVHYPDESYFRY